MLTRFHISSFTGLTIAVWLLLLWFQGMPVLSADFVKPFGIVVTVMFFLVSLFNKYLWSWKIFKWYVKQPDLRGTWKVELKSSWINHEAGEKKEPIYGYAVVRQSLTFLSIRLMTEESRSALVAHSIEKQNDDLFKLFGVYRNEPDLEFQGVKSVIHYGSFMMEIYGSPVYELQGHYWTDRATKGGIKLTDRVKKLCETYAQAESEFIN